MAIVFALGLGACASLPPPVTAADADRVHVDLAQLQTGRTLVIKKCGGCHHTPKPLDKPAGEWPHWVDEMKVRAHLEGDERQTIETYLASLSR